LEWRQAEVLAASWDGSMAGELDDIRDVLGFFMGIEAGKEKETRQAQAQTERDKSLHGMLLERQGARTSTATPFMTHEAKTHFSKHPEMQKTPENIATVQTTVEKEAEDKAVAKKKEAEEKAAARTQKSSMKTVRTKTATEFRTLTQQLNKLSSEEAVEKVRSLGYEGAITKTYPKEGRVVPRYRGKERREAQAKRESKKALTTQEAEGKGLVKYTINKPRLRALIKKRHMKLQEAKYEARPLTAYQKRKQAEGAKRPQALGQEKTPAFPPKKAFEVMNREFFGGSFGEG